MEIKVKKALIERINVIPSEPLPVDFYKLCLDKKDGKEDVYAKSGTVRTSIFKPVDEQIDYESLFFRYTEEKNNILFYVNNNDIDSTEELGRALAYYAINTIKLPVILTYGLDFEASWLANYPFDICIFKVASKDNRTFIDEYKKCNRIVISCNNYHRNTRKFSLYLSTDGYYEYDDSLTSPNYKKYTAEGLEIFARKKQSLKDSQKPKEKILNISSYYHSNFNYHNAEEIKSNIVNYDSWFQEDKNKFEELCKNETDLKKLGNRHIYMRIFIMSFLWNVIVTI